MARFATLCKPYHVVKQFLWYIKSLGIPLECILPKASLIYINLLVFLHENFKSGPFKDWGAYYFTSYVWPNVKLLEDSTLSGMEMRRMFRNRVKKDTF